MTGRRRAIPRNDRHECVTRKLAGMRYLAAFWLSSEWIGVLIVYKSEDSHGYLAM